MEAVDTKEILRLHNIIEDLREQVELLETQLDLQKQTSLAVVRRLQARIDELEGKNPYIHNFLRY